MSGRAGVVDLRADEADASGRWLDRAIRIRTNLPAPIAALAIAGALLACFELRQAAGDALVSTTLYIPMILLAAARFGSVGAVTAAAGATALAGPLATFARAQDPEPLVLWAGRGIVYFAVAMLTSVLIERIVADRQRERELAERERELAVRKAAVLATVSHEFRTPLTVIVGVARTLEAQQMVAEDGRPLLDGLSQAARRLTDLVNTIGAVMDDEAGTFVRREPVILCEILTHVVGSLGVRDARNRVLTMVDPSANVLVSDRELLDQLLRHIVENAVRHSPEGSLVELEATRTAERLCVRVADRGPGIPEDLIRRNDPFRQRDQSMTRTGRGLGLGLFAASRIAQVLGGEVRFESREGGGTMALIEVEAGDVVDWAPAASQRGAFAT